MVQLAQRYHFDKTNWWERARFSIFSAPTFFHVANVFHKLKAKVWDHLQSLDKTWGFLDAVLNLCTHFMINFSWYLFLIEMLLSISTNFTRKLMIFSQYISYSLSKEAPIMCSTYRLLLKHSVSIIAPPLFLQSLLPHMLNRSRYTFIHPDPKSSTLLPPALFVH